MLLYSIYLNCTRMLAPLGDRIGLDSTPGKYRSWQHDRYLPSASTIFDASAFHFDIDLKAAIIAC
ncbi:hypothetical protein [Chamaesiphon polymorphus]|uniref:Uncharacterized protein n=1 Tax=Chamaesiphon polymorphus CCALA 037 TaxID=2107692 RepID=A0A2T1FAF5_9CYAN|nr:hypothetical protein [Chamaesiphon polymorphus]PSB41924.1 hypothetical protein C7B77_27045 [Chamaesiphon polymorphus CCALA 037]